MNLSTLLAYKGVTLSRGMDTTAMINCLNNLPGILSAFPSIQGYVNTLTNTFNSLQKAKETLADTQSKLTKAENVLSEAEDKYNAILSAGGTYIAPGGTGGPVTPGTVVAGYAVIQSAKNGLVAAQKAVSKAEQEVNKIVSKIEEYKGDLMNTLMSTEVR